MSLEEPGYGQGNRPSLPPGLRAAFGGFVVLIVLNLINLFGLRLPLAVFYPIQFIAYVVVGRIAAATARDEDAYGGMQIGIATDLNYGAIGGSAALSLCILIWLLYAVLALWLAVARLGGFAAGFFGWAICLAIDLPIAVGAGAFGGNSAKPT